VNTSDRIRSDRIRSDQVRPDQIRLRVALADEWEALWALRTRCVREICSSHYPPHVVGPWSASPPPPSFLRLLAIGGCLLAEDEASGELLGYGAIDAESAEIDALFVAPDQTGRGLGLRLLRALEQCVPAGTELKLSAALNAEAFYRRAGYRPVRREIYPHPSGIELDSVVMNRRV